MKTEVFLKAYSESRNGANEFYKHSMVRSFVYSDGVRDCAMAGCYWLIDICATELPKVMRDSRESLGCLSALVKGTEADLTLTGSGDKVLWSKKIGYTDMPEGEWMFGLGADGDGIYRMILLSEY